MSTGDPATTLAAYAKKQLDLRDAQLSNEYYYAHLPLCVIDAVFSIGVNYQGVINTVTRWCAAQNPRWQIHREHGSAFPAAGKQVSVATFVRLLGNDDERLAADILRNRQRTSPRKGILKATAVLRFAEALLRYKVDTFQDLEALTEEQLELLKAEVARIPGQKSGLSFDYFRMLAGNEGQVKPDRMICRFVGRAVRRNVSPVEAAALVRRAAAILAREFSGLTPRLLDYVIWRYQRGLGRGPRRGTAGVHD